MGTIVMDGDAKVAPVYLPIRGGAVAWSGKSSDQMSRADFNAISLFCKDKAWEMGYEDGLEGRAKRNNPFHISFLEGNPHAMFSDSYHRGWSMARSELRRQAQEQRESSLSLVGKRQELAQGAYRALTT